MNLFHLTPINNLNSIMKNGLIPQKPYLPHHYKSFKENYNIEKVIYTTVDSGKYFLRYIKDFIYWAEMNKPKSIAFENLKGDELDKLWNENSYDVLPNLKIRNIEYALLMLKHQDFNPHDILFHAQEPTYKGYGTILEEYCHNDKPICISSSNINSKKLKFVGSVLVDSSKRNKINMTFRWHKKQHV